MPGPSRPAPAATKKTQAVSDLAEAIRAYRGEPLHAVAEVELSLARFRMQRRTDGELAQRVERLTPRELEILQRVATGEPSSEIAEELGMSRHTLRTHIQNVLTKLGVHSKTDAVVAAIGSARSRRTDRPRARRILSDPVASASRGGACAADPSGSTSAARVDRGRSPGS